MIVYGLWHGGPSYRAPEPHETETFGSIAEARRVFRARTEGFDPVTCTWMPCVQDSEMLLYPDDPAAGAHPIARIYMGPRGGVREEAV